MQTQLATPMLGGLSPAQFMRRHWQKKPLLVRQAFPGVTPPIARSALFQLAASADVESRLVQRSGEHWVVRHGPLPRRSLPAIKSPSWTLLIQGLDLHVPAAHELLNRFRFIPDARLDDLMLSWANDGGGVGPHLDSYDVFLLQVQGRRRWQIGRASDESFIDGLPLRVLRKFEPETEWTLDPGDMLYLPPRWAHDGVAVGECMTCSIGFRAPAAGALAGELMSRVGEHALDGDTSMYRDASQLATSSPGAIPHHLQRYAHLAVARALRDPRKLERALGEFMTEPKPRVWFAPGRHGNLSHGVRLASATRFMYDARHVFINGESFIAGGRDTKLLRLLADKRQLDAAACRLLTTSAVRLMLEWLGHGWLESL